MFRKMCVLFVTITLVATTALGFSDLDAQGKAKLAESFSNSMVQVRYTLQYDRGESPGQVDQMWNYRMFGAAAMMQQYEDWEQTISEERPVLRGGFLLSPTEVLTSDLALHPRFYKSIEVKLGNDYVPAIIDGFFLEDGTVLLKLERPLKEASPLQFDAKAEGPFYSLNYQHGDGMWMTSIQTLGGSIVINERNQRLFSVHPLALIVSAEGKAVGASGRMQLEVGDSWKGSPREWDKLSAVELQDLIGRIRGASDRALPRVRVSFRSPRMEDGNMYGYGYGQSDGETETEWNGTGVLISDQRILVLGNFKTKRTARLERITVYDADGQEHEAVFVGTLKDHGALVAELEEPLSGAAVLANSPILDLRNQLLIEAAITINGENRITYFKQQRIKGYVTSWGGDVYPGLSAASSGGGGYYGYSEGAMGLNFLFQTDGSLLAIPLDRRRKVTVEEQWGSSDLLLVPATYLIPILEDLENNIDPDNRPLTEEEEGRLAWLGIEYQPMNPDLARVNEITHLTSGGMSGALITYVYENSPAENKGLEMGDILLRIHVEGHPKPLEISGGMEGYFSSGFPWEYYDQMGAEYFDQMPSPWGSVDNALNRPLTELGFGTPYTADVYRNGEVVKIDFVVEEGPKYYKSAARFKSKDLGMSVRDMTYEVRRYFQIAEGEPGIVIAKIESGEKAAVAGMKPYELIISVDGQLIHTTAEFEEAVKKTGDLKLFIKRMTEGRTVKIKSEPETENQED